ncbi:hypothetical protein CspHIS471_0409920 [Cutaneotrichosporon sp. HIS471]|nr:hypothetical protein CspHIS471_0409920 [Cutaneotrichosporon sp. HIS471]
MAIRPQSSLPELRAHIYRLNQQISKNTEKMDDLERSASCSETCEYMREAITNANRVNRLIITELQRAMWKITESWRTPSGSSDSELSDSGSDEEGVVRKAKNGKQVRWADDESGL